MNTKYFLIGLISPLLLAICFLWYYHIGYQNGYNVAYQEILQANANTCYVEPFIYQNEPDGLNIDEQSKYKSTPTAEDFYLNGYRLLYNQDPNTAFKVDPKLYQQWSGYSSPKAHRQWLDEHAR